MCCQLSIKRTFNFLQSSGRLRHRFSISELDTVTNTYSKNKNIYTAWCDYFLRGTYEHKLVKFRNQGQNPPS